jgi:hypothetical protein
VKSPAKHQRTKASPPSQQCFLEGIQVLLVLCDLHVQALADLTKLFLPDFTADFGVKGLILADLSADILQRAL